MEGTTCVVLITSEPCMAVGHGREVDKLEAVPVALTPAFSNSRRWLAYILLLLLDLIICLFTLLGLAKQIKWLVIV